MRWAFVLVATLALIELNGRCHALQVVVQRNRTANVDTRIGSGGFGFGIGEINPGPTMPFGCLRLGPDTSIGLEPIRIPFQTYAGYAYDSNWVECFSHTHVVGAGLGDFQNFGVTVARKWNNDVVQNAGYKSLYSHNQEVALPGYYAVELLTHNVYAELTVSGTHAAMHRYTCRSLWPSTQDAPCVLVLDVCHGFPKTFINDTQQCKQAQVLNISSPDNGYTIETTAYMLMDGAFSGGGQLGGLEMWLFMIVTAEESTTTSDGHTTVSPVSLQTGMWEGGQILSSFPFLDQTTSGSLGVSYMVPSNTGTNIVFHVRAGLSFISPANARLNLFNQQQTPDSKTWFTFEESVQRAVDAWEDVLSAVAYQGGAGDDAWHRTAFDSTMYRAHLAPSTYSESNGEYLGLDNQVHVVPAGTRHISDLSIWDIYRTQAPMLLWTKPDLALDLATSMLDDYAITHQLPKWVFANIETGCMVGLHSAVIFADYAAKNLAGVNATEILQIIANGVQGQNAQLEPWGFVPTEHSSEGASNTQDYAIDAAAVAFLATFLNDTALAQNFSGYAQSYRNVWDPVSNFFCPRWANGTFSCPDVLLTYPFEHSYTEGDAWQYRWYVPQDVRGLISLFPNTTSFVDNLYDFFDLSYLWPLNTTLPNPYFWAGNEPDIQTPMLFNWAGNEYAYLTSAWFPQLLDTYYIPYAAGLPGDDDYGAMSAWAFWGYLGIFPMVPSAEYALFAPRFDDINFTLSSSELRVSPWRNVPQSAGPQQRTTVVRIQCVGRPSSGIAYVASITLNGTPLPTPIVTHDQLLSLDGSPTVLAFTLVGEPTVFGQAPPSLGGPEVYKPSSKRGSQFQEVAKPSEKELRHILIKARQLKLQRLSSSRKTKQ